MQEDLSRVRTPNSALVLGVVRRVVLSLSNAAVDKARQQNPKSKCNTKSFRQRFLSARGGRERLQALVFAKNPAVLDLGPVQELIPSCPGKEGVVPFRQVGVLEKVECFHLAVGDLNVSRVAPGI